MTRVVLWVRLHCPAAPLGNHLQGLVKGGGRNPVTSSLPVDEETGDAPVREILQTLLVGLSAPDIRKFVGRSELAPTNRVLPVEDEGGVRPPFPNAFFLHFAIIPGRHLAPFWVEME